MYVEGIASFQTKYRNVKMEQIKDVNREKDDCNLNKFTNQNPMLIVMDDLIKSIQQLQKVIVVQNTPPNTDLIKENKIQELNKSQNSQAALLLHQVQSAMEATIAQLSSNNRIFSEEISSPIELKPQPNEVVQSISEKWRMYTEMVQLKSEPSKEYCIMKMRLGQELGLTFKETKREMLIGLWNNRLCIVLHLKTHLNEDEILNDIDEWEKIENARNEIGKRYRRK